MSHVSRIGFALLSFTTILLAQNSRIHVDLVRCHPSPNFTRGRREERWHARMGAKTKKKTPASPCADSSAAADADVPAGTLLLQVCEPPPECKALSVCLHWEDMRRANLVLGGAVHVSAASDGSEEGRAPAPTLLLSAWSSGRVPPGRAGLPPTVRAALGTVSHRGIWLRAAATPEAALAPTYAAVVHLGAQDAAQERALGLRSWGDERQAWLEAALQGAYVQAGAVLALRLHGQPMPLRVVRVEARPAPAAEARVRPATAPSGGGGGGGEAAEGAPPASPAPPAPPAPLRADGATRVRLVPFGSGGKASKKDGPTLRDVAGMRGVLAAIRETVELPLTQPGLFASVGVPPPTGLLLFGPPGTGKTMVARALARELKVHCALVGAAELLSREGEAEAKLDALFAEARRCAPSLIFLDEVDAIGAARDSADRAGEARLLAALLTHMDGVHARREPLFVLAATNRPQALDPALRRPGRFDREIEVGVPGEAARREILSSLLARTPHALAAADLDEAARRTAGFVGADLAALHRHAALAALARAAPDSSAAGAGAVAAAGGAAEAEGGAAAAEVGWEDMLAALTQVGPSALRELELQVPRVSWDDIGGQHELKQARGVGGRGKGGGGDVSGSGYSGWPSTSVRARCICPAGRRCKRRCSGRCSTPRPSRALECGRRAVCSSTARPAARRHSPPRRSPPPPLASYPLPRPCPSVPPPTTHAVPVSEPLPCGDRPWPARRAPTSSPSRAPSCSLSTSARASRRSPRSSLRWAAYMHTYIHMHLSPRTAAASRSPPAGSPSSSFSHPPTHLVDTQARAASPAIIFFDEIDALAASRDGAAAGGGVGARVLSQLLHEMDGLLPLQARRLHARRTHTACACADYTHMHEMGGLLLSTP